MIKMKHKNMSGLKAGPKKRIPLLLLALALAAVPVTAYAANVAYLNWVTLTQSVNSSGQYVYSDGSKSTTDVDTDMPGRVIKGADGWYYVKAGTVQTDVTGCYSNQNGWWRIENGKVNFTANGILRDSSQYTKDADGNWVSQWTYYENGKRQFIVNNTADKNANGWWYLEDGQVAFDYTGFVRNANGIWYVVDGKIDFTHKGIYKDEYGVVDGTVGAWYYVEGNHCDLTVDTVEKNENGWWFVVNGKVDFNYTGVGVNSNGYWKVESGKVNFNYNGFYDGFYFSGGKAVSHANNY